MKIALLALLFSVGALAQDSGWVRSQWNDKLTGNAVVAYQLTPQPDGSGRKPWIGITCDQAAQRFTYGYFTDEMVSIDAQYANVSTLYYPATVQYRSDSAKVKQDAITVRSDFRTINLDDGMFRALTSGSEFAISFPSQRGYMVTDVFRSSSLPLQYIGDCYTDKMKRKLMKSKGRSN